MSRENQQIFQYPPDIELPSNLELTVVSRQEEILTLYRASILSRLDSISRSLMQEITTSDPNDKIQIVKIVDAVADDLIQTYQNGLKKDMALEFARKVRKLIRAHTNLPLAE